MTKSPVPQEVQMALGRMFAMMMRPAQPGDVDTYHAIRQICMEHAPDSAAPYTHNWARDRLAGAQGD